MDAVTGSSALMSLIFGFIHSPPPVPVTTLITFYSYDRQANICLFNCSRVNKLWHYESCRLLWNRQPTLSNITKLLKPDNEFLSPLERKSAAIGSISLVRFSHYSRWISQLRCSIPKDCSNLKDAVLLSKGTLFPCLKNLTFVAIHRNSTLAALALLGPQIQVMSFCRGILSEVVVFIMSRWEGSQLRVLHIPHTRPVADDRTHLRDVILGQKMLTDLTLHSHWVDLEMFHAIGGLPCLLLLKIADYEWLTASGTIFDTPAALEKSERRGSMFPSLQRLAFTSPSFVWKKVADSIFADTKLSFLELTLVCQDEDNPADLAVALSSASRLACLEEIDIKVDWADDGSTARVTAGALQPLSKCYLLQKLRLRTPRLPIINDRELLLLVKNWPNLRDLHIAETLFIRREDTHGLSINLIGKIQAVCPRISSLTLPCSSSVEFESMPNLPPPNLKSLDLGISFLFDTQLADWSNRLVMIASYLAIIIPAKCTLSFDVDYYELDHQMSGQEWTQLTTAHEESTALITSHRAAIHTAHNLQVQLGIPTALPL